MVVTTGSQTRVQDRAVATASLGHEAITATLQAAVRLTGMELAYVAQLTDRNLRIVRTYAREPWPGTDPGMVVDRDEALCARMVDGAPNVTSDAAAVPAYRDLPLRAELGIVSYLGVPVEHADGSLFGTLCSIDRHSIDVSPAVVDGLRALAGVISAHLPRESVDLSVTPGPAIRRQGHTWIVSDGGGQTEEAEDLTSAMVLADLLAADLGLLDVRAPRPPRLEPDADTADRLEVAVQQLEHALAARVSVEQAIGVLAERRHLPPRAAFEALRSVARGSGRRVHDLAREVVASTTNPTATNPTATNPTITTSAGPGSPAPRSPQPPRPRAVPTPSVVARRIKPPLPPEGNAAP